MLTAKRLSFEDEISCAIDVKKFDWNALIPYKRKKHHNNKVIKVSGFTLFFSRYFNFCSVTLPEYIYRYTEYLFTVIS